MSFRLVDEAKKEFPVHRLCRALGVSQSGYFAWKGRPACRRQHEDMVLLAHVRSAFALSNGTYGSPRMTRELRDNGLPVGRRRTALDAGERAPGAAEAAVQADHGQPPRLAGGAELARSGFRGGRAG
jgi:hypothetical protein